MLKAIPVEVYRHGGVDCTNGGISSKYSSLLVISDYGWRCVDENNMPENVCKLVKRHLFGRDVYHIEPYNAPTGAGWMAGGNFAHTSDSRFERAVGGMYGAVAIHDRQETWDEYNSYD